MQSHTLGRRYGWKPDLPDFRDHLFAPAPRTTPLPTSVDLRPGMPPVYDQGQLGSCTGNATAGAVQFDRMKQNEANADLVPSRLFIYYGERVIEHTVSQDSGAQIRDGIKTLAKTGACFESGDNAWPYDTDKFAHKPPAECYAVAKFDKAVEYSRVVNTDIDQIKGALADGHPVVFGFTVYESFEGPDVAKNGFVPMPAPHESVVGGHAVLCVGYDDANERFIVRNSWAADWGDKGYCYMPYAYLTDANLADDFWVVKLVSSQK